MNKLSVLLVSFTKEQLIFAALFAIVFVIAMIWAYRKDMNTYLTKYYKNTYMILVGIIVLIFCLWLYVKLST
ncbi:MAG: hypothetical protein ACK4IK_05860 [Bacteroidia bacterium]